MNRWRLIKLQSIYTHILEYKPRLIILLLESYNRDDIGMFKFFQYLRLSPSNSMIIFHNFYSTGGTFREQHTLEHITKITTSNGILNLIFFH